MVAVARRMVEHIRHAKSCERLVLVVIRTIVFLSLHLRHGGTGPQKAPKHAGMKLGENTSWFHIHRDLEGSETRPGLS